MTDKPGNQSTGTEGTRGGALPHPHSTGEPAGEQRQHSSTWAQHYQVMLEAQLNAFFVAAPAGMVLFDEQMRFQNINETAAQMNGLSREAHIGKTIAEVLPGLAGVEAIYRQALTTGKPVQNIEVSGTTSSSYAHERSWQLSVFPIPGAHGSISGVGGIFVEITELKQAREMLQHTNEALEQRVVERTAELSDMNTLMAREIEERQRIEEALAAQSASLARQVEEQTADLRIANAQLERAARLKDEFLANMSHELRTPLNAILGLSEMLHDEVYGTLNEKQQKAMQTIAESGSHLLALINDILDLAKVGAGKTELDITPVVLESVCQTSLRLIRQNAYKKQITVSERLDERVTRIHADERRLKQMLVNLLSNAVKFTPEGGSVGLEVRLDEEQHAINFTIWDTGIGIAPDDLPRLFQPFEQIDSSLSRRYEGTGLGLVLVARLAEMHGGSISVESEEGKGSRFTITLPTRPPAAPHSSAAPPAVSAPASGTAGSAPPLQCALIVEDSPTAAEQMSRYLSAMDVRSSIATRGATVVEQAAAIQPQLIILDILLPDISGWDILQALKADPRTHHIPVLVISVVDEAAKGRALGATGYLLKPISREQFAEALHRLFQSEQPAAEPEAVPATGAASPLVLLAEDNEENITMVAEYLQARGYRVEIARSGTQAVEYSRRIKPDLILMDIQMPGMDGLEATKHIRADTTLSHTPIIALTALAMPGDRERCLQAGANDYMSKPVSLRKLLHLIEYHRTSS